MTKKEIYRRRIKSNPDLTAFQKKVLVAALEIPKGKVRTYSWVAGKTGSPRACRAVGQALGKNPYAPHVPCHRVISFDGSIGGYSGGPAKKRELLKDEGVTCN